MRRRTFLAALGAAACTFAARADERIPRIGYLHQATAEVNKPLLEAFEAGLKDLGYIPGETIAIEARFADGRDEKMAELAKQLVDLGVDLILTSGPGVFAAHGVTKTLPIVATAVPDPVAFGLAESLAHPGGNVTGETFFALEVAAKRVALLKQVKPGMKSFGVLFPRDDPFMTKALRAGEAQTKALGVEAVPIDVADPSDCERALSAGPGASIGGLQVVEAPKFAAASWQTAIAAAAARHGLPSAGAPYYARNGGLLGYGVNFVAMWRRAAVFVDKILKGAKPGDIPIEQATRFVTVVNLKTAKALGLDIPPDILAAADEVIE
jgi:putative tryptophan/tyrosine transport system substrate-binding protein